MKPRLGLVVALAAEARSMLGRRRWFPSDGRKIQHTYLDHGGELLCVCSGIGTENARLSSQWLVDRGINGLAVVGVSGGLNPMLRAGDLVVADTIIGSKGHKAHCRWNTDTDFSHQIHSALIAEGITVHRGSIITCRMPVLVCESKAWLFRQSGAQAVDMESAAVAHVAAAENLPLFAMRAICDTAANTVPQTLCDILDPANTYRWQGVVNTLLQTPARIVDAVRLGKNFCIALSALRKGWRLQMKHGLITRFVFRKHPSGDPAHASSSKVQEPRQGLLM